MKIEAIGSVKETYIQKTAREAREKKMKDIPELLALGKEMKEGLDNINLAMRDQGLVNAQNAINESQMFLDLYGIGGLMDTKA